jgi:hypothetical protein
MYPKLYAFVVSVAWLAPAQPAHAGLTAPPLESLLSGAAISASAFPNNARATAREASSASPPDRLSNAAISQHERSFKP